MNEMVVLKSPVGYLQCLFDQGHVVSIDITARSVRSSQKKMPPYAVRLVGELEAYFAGHLYAFTVSFPFPSGTAFQQQVWRTLLTIPYGETRSYGWLAAAVGKPHAARAVGQAVGKNPLPLLIPCHRIIAADGSIGGFSFGAPVKKWLLEREKI